MKKKIRNANQGKLSLHRETLRELQDPGLRKEVAGGVFSFNQNTCPFTTWPTCHPT